MHSLECCHYGVEVMPPSKKEGHIALYIFMPPPFQRRRGILRCTYLCPPSKKEGHIALYIFMPPFKEGGTYCVVHIYAPPPPPPPSKKEGHIALYIFMPPFKEGGAYCVTHIYAPFKEGGAYCVAHVCRYPLTLCN